MDDHFADIFNWSGLCGGMIYTAADYYYKNMVIPNQDYTPSPGTKLYNHLWSRQSKAHENIAGQIAEFEFNPFGWRDDEFWRWGVNEKLRQLVNNINNNRPTPTVLLRKSNEILMDIADNHWVLIVGYDLGRYNWKMDKDPYFEDIKIIVYDPNKSDGYRVLTPKRESGKLIFMYGDYDLRSKSFSRKNGWDCITYHPNTHFYKSVQTPPSVKMLPTNGRGNVFQIVARCNTGKDDLRGGYDNVSFKINYANGTSQMCSNVNLKRRLRSWSVANFELPLNRRIDVSRIKSVEVSTSLAGGLFGDNWDVSSLVLTAYKDDGTKTAIGSLFNKRFTGERRTQKVFNSHYKPIGSSNAKEKKLLSINASSFSTPIHNNDCRRIQGDISISCHNSKTHKEYKAITSKKLIHFPGSKSHNFAFHKFDQNYNSKEVKFEIDKTAHAKNEYYFKVNSSTLKRCHKSCDLCRGYHCRIQYPNSSKVYGSSFRNNNYTVKLKATNSSRKEHHDISLGLRVSK